MHDISGQMYAFDTYEMGKIGLYAAPLTLFKKYLIYILGNSIALKIGIRLE